MNHVIEQSYFLLSFSDVYIVIYICCWTYIYLHMIPKKIQLAKKQSHRKRTKLLLMWFRKFLSHAPFLICRILLKKKENIWGKIDKGKFCIYFTLSYLVFCYVLSSFYGHLCLIFILLVNFE